jgi:hypothetical protein
MTESRTDSGLAGFDKLGHSEYNPLYIKDDLPLVAISPTDIYPSCCAHMDKCLYVRLTLKYRPSYRHKK